MKNEQVKRFSCSSFGRIMSGAALPGAAILTAAQQRDLETLLTKDKRTDKQEQTMQELIAKRDTILVPQLSKGAKTFIEDEYIKDRFGFKKTFTNIYTEKGNLLEQRSIREVGQYLGYKFATKAPEKFMRNDYLKTRGYDWKVKRFVFDQKNVWDPTGLKLLQEESELALYEWQIRGYKMLINELEGGNIESGAVIRVLMNPTEEQVLKQAKIMFVNDGNDWADSMPTEFVQEVQDMFDFEAKFPDIADRMRIYPVECLPEHEQLIRIYVGLAQEYYESLEERVEHVNDGKVSMFRNV